MKKKKNKVYDVYFMFRNFVVDSYTSGEAYGEWWQEHQTDIGDTYTREKSDGRIESLKVNFKPTENIYLVYGIYNTGDSFGYSNGEAEILEIFETADEANEFSNKVNSFNELVTSDMYGLKPKEKTEKINKIKDVLGNSLQESDSSWRKYDFIHKGQVLSFPWGGYFENLSFVDVKELEIAK